ncbi:MAG TPA: MarR family transcriptional regulator [Hyphomicrobiales bacterium]|nr:MarR family transcriptional regulator [Hyphomicrobiales bacterium]
MADPSELAEVLRPTIFRLSRLLRRQMDGSGMSPLQSLLLAVIEQRPGIGVGELARLEGLRGPTMSGHVKQMEEEGLIARTEPDCADRRRVGLAVTAKGRDSLERLRRQRRDWLAGRLAGLAPEARQAIAAAIDPLRQLGSQDEPAASR